MQYDRKGVDEEGYAVARVVEDVKWLGYTRLVLKTDGEKAIVKLLKESLKRIKTDVADQAGFETLHLTTPGRTGPSRMRYACSKVCSGQRSWHLSLEQGNVSHSNTS